MATRGYNSYRGRVSTGRIVLIVVLVLILLGAVGYLAVQNYLVYDEAGQVHLELPWGRHDGTPTSDKTPVEDVDIDRLEPESTLTPVTALHATRLPDDCLWWGADYIMSTLASEDMVLAVKRENGGITYGTQVSVPQNVIVEQGRPLDCLKQLLASDRYTVARICCFSDSAYAQGLPETALVREDDSLWYDANGGAWLDPTNPAVLSYITALSTECAELGVRRDPAGLVLLSGGGRSGGYRQRRQRPCADPHRLRQEPAQQSAGGRSPVGDAARQRGQRPDGDPAGGAVRPHLSPVRRGRGSGAAAAAQGLRRGDAAGGSGCGGAGVRQLRYQQLNVKKRPSGVCRTAFFLC